MAGSKQISHSEIFLLRLLSYFPLPPLTAKPSSFCLGPTLPSLGCGSISFQPPEAHHRTKCWRSTAERFALFISSFPSMKQSPGKRKPLGALEPEVSQENKTKQKREDIVSMGQVKVAQPVPASSAPTPSSQLWAISAVLWYSPTTEDRETIPGKPLIPGV